MARELEHRRHAFHFRTEPSVHGGLVHAVFFGGLLNGDASFRLRVGHGAKNMAVVRHFTLNLVRQVADKRSINGESAPPGILNTCWRFWDRCNVNLDSLPCGVARALAAARYSDGSRRRMDPGASEVRDLAAG
jgi:hypothetical protein